MRISTIGLWMVFLFILRFILHRPFGKLVPLYSRNIKDVYFLDGYSFTHITHGLILYTIKPSWNFGLIIEMIWEIIENTSFSIAWFQDSSELYYYRGDSILNSSGDCICCLFGMWLCSRFLMKSKVYSILAFLALDLGTQRFYGDCLFYIIFRSIQRFALLLF